ncbi:MAG: acyltransferase [Undibacterium sp.]|uniref:acyltransferase family protein n=1 Tax=Undibacterium sp. TaxID=1914977 RepID=UPI00271C54E9|nr:acyltransferase [Undibacterium sp.]MDO8652468.1 acyltransferase [Undibacterium sp.]
MSRVECLTGLRGVAALVVLLSHIIQIYWLRYEMLPPWIRGVSSISSDFAVKVFFVLSGFLIAHSIEENVNRNKGLFDVKSYIAARLARIYPPFIFSIAISVFVFLFLYVFNMPGVAYPLKFPGDAYSARDYLTLSKNELLFSLIMLQGLLQLNGPLWSLYIEVKLYLIYACFYLIILGSKRFSAMIGFSLISYVAIRLNPEFLRYATIWLVGSIAYYMFGIVGRRLNSKAAACLLLVAFIVCTDIAKSYIVSPALSQSPPLILLDLLLAVVISAIVLKFNFRLPLIHDVGTISYSLYVTHFPVLLFLQSVSVYLSDDSILKNVVVSFLALWAALVVGYAGGRLEAKKIEYQTIIIGILSRLSIR